ncbi:metallophosphoesterase [Pseudomonas hormoni]|uniref:Metallophosphoesterase n=1 Tax=Pseudomonas hormoni TaxID=3093767 RepID=A0ABX8EZQ4_9PSED|nr:metallophosphoesterase [Pseudomonas hormoni]QVW25164.1 metallophosphoesterase [Pseudomonas hormoni]
MELYKKINLLLCLTMTLSLPVAYGASEVQMPKHLVFASDPQYPWTDLTDRGISDPDKEKRSKELIETQYSDIANFRKLNGGASRIPVMINGDMTAFGHRGERSTVKSILNQYLKDDYDYGLGNHDYENNIDDCWAPENNCAAGSITELKEKYWGKVSSFDFAARSEGGAKIYYGSLAYSRSFGDVHLVQLNNEPTYSVNFSSGFFNTENYEINDALDWLERDLRQARAQGKIILLNMHKPDEWKGSAEQIERFKKMIERYEVTAVFAGHMHSRPGKYTRWNTRQYFGEVPVFLSGSSSHQTYLIASFAPDRKTLTVHQVNGNNWPSRKVVDVVVVR